MCYILLPFAFPLCWSLYHAYADNVEEFLVLLALSYNFFATFVVFYRSSMCFSPSILGNYFSWVGIFFGHKRLIRKYEASLGVTLRRHPKTYVVPS
jgi:hypothetical protein